MLSRGKYLLSLAKNKSCLKDEKTAALKFQDLFEDEVGNGELVSE